MVVYLSRADWHARPPRGAGRRFAAGELDGVAYHWPGSEATLHTRSAVAKALRGWQSYHQDGRGWNDIAYNLAVDQAGDVWTLRGVQIRSAANGNQAVNSRYMAVLLLVALGELPTPQLVRTTKLMTGYLQRVWPTARKLVGHNDVSPAGTLCPGPAINRLLGQRAFEPD